MSATARTGHTATRMNHAMDERGSIALTTAGHTAIAAIATMANRIAPIVSETLRIRRRTMLRLSGSS